MIQSIMILTFFVSAPAATTDRTKKINDNEHTLQATRRWSDFWLSPSKRAAVISLSPSLPSTHRVAGRKSVLKLGKPVNEYDIIVDFSPSSPHPTTTRSTFDGAFAWASGTIPGNELGKTRNIRRPRWMFRAPEMLGPARRIYCDRVRTPSIGVISTARLILL